MSLPNELWLYVFNHFSVGDLLSVYRVNKHWRSLVLSIDESTHCLLFKKAIVDMDHPCESPHSVSLDNRKSYVSKIESNAGILIPEPYRTVLTEWPSKHAPAGSHWPHAVRFHATVFCSCHRIMHEGEQCFCESRAVHTRHIILQTSLLTMIVNREPFDFHHPSDDSRWELFSNPPRLHTDTQNEQTLRSIRIQPRNKWSVSSSGIWQTLPLRMLRLSRYTSIGNGSMVTGDFVMILEGPSRGEIHSWDSGGWYNGFEAMSFLEWRYDEWKGEEVTRW